MDDERYDEAEKKFSAMSDHELGRVWWDRWEFDDDESTAYVCVTQERKWEVDSADSLIKAMWASAPDDDGRREVIYEFYLDIWSFRHHKFCDPTLEWLREQARVHNRVVINFIDAVGFKRYPMPIWIERARKEIRERIACGADDDYILDSIRMCGLPRETELELLAIERRSIRGRIATVRSWVRIWFYRLRYPVDQEL
ncbi:hypothetical protein [Jonesia quinghaiensis]|uniref:hypothetical protein n=1 Tax=Jonesia quinghaiensis TaxID=262806 RepID=UPI00048CA1F9|nr:hypothetical protein [Jonesia quinghaiensis]